jgi:hypothetical protein
MAINFPDSPATNDVFTSGGRSWTWTGDTWQAFVQAMSNGSITNDLIANTTITSAKIANATITATQIANTTITDTQIANAAVTSAKIANATITSAHIANTAITSAHIANATITATQIANATITATQIANTTITNSKLANESVTIGSTAIALGSSNTTIDGLASITSANANVSTKLSVTSVSEPMLVSATAATGTITINYLSNPSVFYTTNASANWTLNVRGNSTVTMNSSIAVGDVATVVFMAQQGTTAYFANVVQVDGTTITPKWQGGTAPTGGNASSIDSYALSILKTAANTYTVLASQTKFA